MKPSVCAHVLIHSHAGLLSAEHLESGSRSMLPGLKLVSRPPLLLTFAKTMTRWGIRGGNRLVGLFRQLGLLDVVVQYHLGRGVRFNVPLFRADTCWDQRDIEDYERRLVHWSCRLLESLTDVVLFDCGADIGTFSALVCSQTSSVARVVAFEPNPDVEAFLKHNLSYLKVSSLAITKAVSCFEGTGRLEVPDYDSSDHARYLVPGDGSLEVVTIDSFGVRSGDVAIKIDVGGGELDVLKGAAQTISSARTCMVALEANPRVVRRTKRDPVECLRFLQSLRPFSFVIAETAETPSTSGPVIKNRQKGTRNVIGWTS